MTGQRRTHVVERFERLGLAGDEARSQRFGFWGLVVSLVLYLGSGLAGTRVVLINDFGDWFMYPAMFLVILSFFLFYLKANVRRRGIARVVAAFFTVLLAAFFAWILSDQMPARTIVGSDGGSQFRGDIKGLMVPVVLLVAGAMVHTLHCLFGARRDRH